MFLTMTCGLTRVLPGTKLGRPQNCVLRPGVLTQLLNALKYLLKKINLMQYKMVFVSEVNNINS